MNWIKIIGKKMSVSFILVFLLSARISAQPAPPEIEPFGGGPGTQPGNPIDMYWVLLLLVGVLGIVYFMIKKNKISKI